MSISKQSLKYRTNIPFQQSNNDEYVILLMATNPRKGGNKFEEHPKFCESTINLIQKTRSPNVESNKGDKHNNSYGKYYGFGIINKYKFQDGISFGKFENYKKEHVDTEKQIIENLKIQFSKISDRLQLALRDGLKVGNDQINSLIHFGK